MSAKSQNSKPFGVGDRVRISEGETGMTGILVALLERDYVRVHWNDCSVPITHGRRILEIDGRSRQRIGRGGDLGSPPVTMKRQLAIRPYGWRTLRVWGKGDGQAARESSSKLCP
jgi:hypothetical protein